MTNACANEGKTTGLAHVKNGCNDIFKHHCTPNA